MKRVAIVQRVLPHYRVQFFRRLHQDLATSGVDLQIFYGDEYPGTVPRTIDLDEPWARKIENRYVHLGGAEVVWQPCFRAVRRADLVIIEQAGRLPLNYLLLLDRWVRGTRVAFWGHGRNFQAPDTHRLRASLKRVLITRVDWWFAYTELSARYVEDSGVPRAKITVVDNSIDSAPLSAARLGASADEQAKARAMLGIPDGAPVGLYCGGLHPGKQIGFLLEAATAIRRERPDFHLLIVGDGPQGGKVEAFVSAHPWAHRLGPIFGPERAVYFAIASAVLMPAHVGLVVIDSFATGTPLIATDHATHSPEVAYLEHGVNGLVSQFDVGAYARTVIEYLDDPALQARLQHGCSEAAQRYTLDNMVTRFSDGIRSCLGHA